jgi:hypothetical protein
VGIGVKQFVHRYFNRLKTHPDHRVRISVGVLLVVGGLLGFLPVLGYWMLPLGLALLSVSSHRARHAYRRLITWWGNGARYLGVTGRSAAQNRRSARSREKRSDP